MVVITGPEGVVILQNRWYSTHRPFDHAVGVTHVDFVSFRLRPLDFAATSAMTSRVLIASPRPRVPVSIMSLSKDARTLYQPSPRLRLGKRNHAITLPVCRQARSLQPASPPHPPRERCVYPVEPCGTELPLRSNRSLQPAISNPHLSYLPLQ